MSVFWRKPVEAFGVPPEIGAAFQAAVVAGAVPASEQALFQSSLDAFAKAVPHPSVRAFLGNRLLFEPAINEQTLVPYGRLIMPSTVELIAHASFHVSVRVGPTWMDFRGDQTSGTIYRVAKPVEKVTTVRAILKGYSSEQLPSTAIGFNFLLPTKRILQIRRDFARAPMPVPWGGPDGESCLSIATKILGAAAPELGIIRAVEPRTFFPHLLLHHPKVALVTIYADAPRSLLANQHLHGEPVGSSRVDLQACKLEYSIVSPK